MKPLQETRGGRRIAGLAVVFAFLALAPLHAQTSREYDVKAAILYNFLTFTEWPGTTFSSPTSPYVIAILGEDPFGPVLDQIVGQETVKGRRVEVVRIRSLNSPPSYHLLFVSASEERVMRQILRQIRYEPVLTVSDLPHFAELGGAVGMLSEGRVGLVINPDTLRAAGLQISSKLLRLSRLVPERVPHR